MTCREIVEFLADYLEGNLSSADRDRFEVHLDMCPDCVAYLNTYAVVPDVLRSSLMPKSHVDAMPDDLVAAIMASFRSAGAFRPDRPSGRDTPSV